MRNKVILMALAAGIASCLALSPAQAVPITGGISIAGGYTTNTGNLNTATSFTSFSAFITSGSGSYSGTSGSVTMNGFTFNPFSAPVTPLWTFMFGGNTYSFDLLTLTQFTQPGDNTLTLKGTGTLKITGFDNTPGTWVFTANQGGDTFSFSSSNSAVPDGGSAVALLGLGFSLVEIVRRKLRTS